ncbi:MAG: RidA family protein, partial [Methanobacterium sp.]|nr:RidA family protein [Methanobacterium sp.]
MSREKVAITTPLGEEFSYSRAVRAGDLIFVSATTATGPDGAARQAGAAGAQA